MTDKQKEMSAEASIKQESSATGVKQEASVSGIGDLVSAMTEAFRQSMGSLQLQEQKTSSIRSPRPYTIGHNFKTWFAQFEDYCALTNISTARRAAYLLNSLDQSAYRAVQLLRLPKDIPYEDFVQALIKRFGSGKTSSEYKLLLKNRNHYPTEDIETYADNLMELVENAYPSAEFQFKEELAKDRFLEGVRCNEGIREQLFVRQPETLPAAVRLVRQLESARLASNNSPHQRSSQYKAQANVLDHPVDRQDTEMKELKALMLKINDRLDKLGNATQQPSYPRGRGGRRRDPAQSVCYACQQVGHFARNCPQKQGNGQLSLGRGTQPQQ